MLVGEPELETKVIGLVLGLGIAITAIIFAVNYWSKSASEPASEFSVPHIEAIGTVDYTVDGDTIKVTLTWVNPSTTDVSTGSGQSVRFSGGIDAPESGDEGYWEAKDFVKELCPGGAEVFLDLDNLSEIPYHDSTPGRRLLGVVYVKIDNALINVNAEVLLWGREAYPDHSWRKYAGLDSEFDSREWLEDDYPYVREQG